MARRMLTRFGFHKVMHLRRPQDFERVYNAGVRSGDAHLLIFAMRNDAGCSRIGLSVSRKHGGAVQRNLKRRRLREAFRLLQHQLPTGLDLILIPRQRDDSTLADFKDSLSRLCRRLMRQLGGNEETSGPNGGT